MVNKGRYLYGLVRAGDAVVLGNVGLEHDGQPARVYTLCVESLGAVVSEMSARQKILPLRKNLDPHHKVIREIMKTTTVIPVTFGHVARSEAEVTQMLRRNRATIEEHLDRMHGKVEMGLKVKWDVDNIFEHLVEIDAELRACRDQLFGRSSAPSQAEKIELGRMFEERRNREREDQTARVTQMFQSCSSEVKVNPIKGDKMVMDVAFLVARANLEAFEERVYQVAGKFSSRYVFDYSGPWAPFNFVELDLKSAAA